MMRRSTMLSTVLAIILAVTALVMWQREARAVPLLDLFDGASLTVLDKQFVDWQLIGTTLSDADLAAIEVTGLADQPLNPGLRYMSVDPFPLTAADESFVDLTFQFSVVAPSATIKDNTLEIVEFELEGFGGIAVFEDVTDASGAFLAAKNVSADPFALNLFDSAEFAPQMSVFVQTSIILGTEGEGDLAALGVLDQRFSQVPIPVPASFALLLTGLAGLSFASGGHRLWRNRQPDST